MEDELFITEILQKGRAAKEKVSAEFSFLTVEQLNWKPSQQSWSIGQCLSHLIISHNSYFAVLRRLTEGTFKMTFWERYSPFSAKCGRMLKDQLQEQVKKKMVAPGKLTPSGSTISLDIIEYYHKNLDTFLEYIAQCRHIDIDKTIIASPVIGVVTYSLRDAFHFLLQHEHRHINQAMRARAGKHFPKE